MQSGKRCWSRAVGTSTALAAATLGGARSATAQFEPVSEVRSARVTAEVGAQRLESSEVAPNLGVWSPSLAEQIRSGPGEAFASAAGPSFLDSQRITLSWTLLSQAQDVLLDASATTEMRWHLRFRLTSPVRFRSFVGASARVEGQSSAFSSLRLMHEAGQLVIDEASGRNQSQVFETILPLGEYLMEADARTVSLNNPFSSSFAALNAQLTFTPIDLRRVGSFRWRTAEGGNGHVYQSWLVGEGSIDWVNSSRFAESMGGTLATPTSQAENLAVFNAIASDPVLWTMSGTPSGPWLGAGQVGGAEPGEGWLWQTGEALTYQNWWLSQPDNNSDANRMAYFGAFGLIRPFWGDYVATDPAIKSFILELPAGYCPADLNGDGFVDDTDFVLFSAAYDAFDCPAGPNCEGDFTGDGLVDDADFVVFTQGYDEFQCPFAG